MVKQAEYIIKYADIYQKQFDILVDAQVEAGIDHKSGFQKAFRDAAHKLQATMPEYDVDNLYASFLELRRDEKDFSIFL